MSHIREFCTSKNHLEAITQLLLLDNKKLRRMIINFIKAYFIPSSGNFTYPPEKLKLLVDLLIYNLDEETGEEALSLLYNIQKVSEDYNNDLDLTVFSLADKELINTNDKIKDSIFLRYLTVPFVKRIIENTSKSDVLKTFMSEDIQEATLIWTSEMRGLLHSTLEEELKEFNSDIKAFIETKTQNFRRVKNIPIYKNALARVINYPQVDKEIRSAEYYLRCWNKSKEKLEHVNRTRFFNNLSNTFQEITNSFPKVDLNNFQIIIKSYLISYSASNGDSRKPKFPFFDMTLKIMEETCKSITIANNQMHMKKMLKFIYKIVYWNY